MPLLICTHHLFFFFNYLWFHSTHTTISLLPKSLLLDNTFHHLFLCYTTHLQFCQTTISQLLHLHLHLYMFQPHTCTSTCSANGTLPHILVTPPFFFFFSFLWKICSYVTLTVNKKNFPEQNRGRIQGESRSQFSSSSPLLLFLLLSPPLPLLSLREGVS